MVGVTAMSVSKKANVYHFIVFQPLVFQFAAINGGFPRAEREKPPACLLYR